MSAEVSKLCQAVIYLRYWNEIHTSELSGGVHFGNSLMKPVRMKRFCALIQGKGKQQFADSDKTQGVASGAFSGFRILMADDHQINCKVTSMLLQKMGFTVECV
ncbi:hypothetical protein RZS08_08250, partial [Arthrospira platensis SPKY1]|nr:hypothetical protein [Arthrospira platensis SPKY1]